MHKTLDLPPIWAAFFAAVAYVLARVAPVREFEGSGPGLIAFFVGSAGFTMILWAAFWFFSKDTPIEPRKSPRSLIVEGPYRINRNPIYTGLAFILAGFCLWLGALSSFVVVPAFVWLITRRFILAEEAALRDKFGQEAEIYLAHTRRW